LVPHHQSEILAAALGQTGVSVLFYAVSGGGHGGFSDPRVTELTQEFLKEKINSKEKKDD
jgi:prolyl oligopeptidase PreP (S9A serine peptidase family)